MQLKNADKSKETAATVVAQISTKSNDLSESNLGSNTTFRGTAEQNELIYKRVPQWRPEGAGGNVKNTSFYTERPDDKIPIIIRQLFWDNYIEMPNKNGQSEANASTIGLALGNDALIMWPTGPDLVNYEFKLPAGVVSKTGQYNTMSYIRSDGVKIEIRKGAAINFPGGL